VLAVLAPKCLFCVAGYLGLAAGLGVTGVELCGGAGFPRSVANIAEATALLLSAAILGWRLQGRSRALRSGLKRAGN